MVAGLMMLLLGAALHFLPRITYLGRLPGDIFIKREHFTLYFPITTCLVISLLLIVLTRLIGRR